MKENRSFLFKIRFAAALHPNKCLNQIKLPISSHTCAPISELTSDISIMIQAGLKTVIAVSVCLCVRPSINISVNDIGFQRLISVDGCSFHCAHEYS